MKVTVLIFKDYEEINRRTGEISKKSGLFTTANYKQVEAGAYYNFKTNAGAIVETVKANREYANGLITLEERNNKVAKATEGCTEEVKKQCDNTKMSYAEGKKAILNLKEQEAAAAKAAKAQNGLGNSIKNFAKNNASMFKNIGAMLLIDAVFQAAGMAWDALNDKFKITPEKKIEAMETAVNKYNDAISKSSENTKTIRSLKDEFNNLAKGVDESGRNIGLSAEQYDRYNEIANQLASISPSIIQSYTAEGNAILDRNSAIEEGIKAQEDYAAAATKAYTANSTGNDIIKGSQVNYSDAIKESRNTLNDVAKAFDDVKVAESKLGSFVPGNRATGVSTTSSILADYFGYEVDLASASLDELKRIDTEWNSIINIARKNGYSEEIIANAQAEYGALHSSIAEIEQSTQPIFEWLSAVVAQTDEAGKSIASTVPESLQAGFQSGLKEISASGKTASEMRTAATNLADSLSTIYESNEKGYATALNEAKKAQQDFMDSDKSKADVEKYNATVEEQIKILNRLADQYRSVGDEFTAAALEAQALEIGDFGQENIMDLERAFNPLVDSINEARKAKENFDAIMESGDYNTAINAYEEIYDDVMDGFDNAGNGTKAFWTAAEQMLGADTLKEYGYDIDKINAKMRSLNGIMGDSEASTDNFYRMLRDNAGELNKLVKDENGNFKELVSIADSGAISFDIDSTDLDEVADKLNISKNLLVAMIDNARHWSDIDLSDNGSVETAIRDMDGTFTNGDKAYQLMDKVGQAAAAAGLNVGEVYRKCQDLENIELIDLTLFDDKETIADAAEQLINMNSILGSGDASKGFKMNADAIISQMKTMGATADQTANVIDQLEQKGWIREGTLNKKAGQSNFDYVNSAFTALDESDPFVQMANSTEKVVEGINQIILALGGIPTDISFTSNSKEIAADINKLQTSESYSASDKQAIQDKIDSQIKYYQKIRNQATSDPTLTEDQKVEINTTANDALLELEEFNKQLNKLPKEKEVGIDIGGDGLASLAEEQKKVESWGLSDKAVKQIKDGTLKSVFGNIDMDKRAVIEWSDALKKQYADALSSWDYSPEVGSIDTVFGGSDDFNIDGKEVEIAYTPILNEDDGSFEFLGEQTVQNYIRSVIDAASQDGKISADEILKIDQQGLNVDTYNSAGEVVGKEFVHGLIAAVGDSDGEFDAGEVGALMHFAGSKGAIGLAFEEIKTAADAAGKSVEDFVTAYNKAHPDAPIEIKYNADTASAQQNIDRVAKSLGAIDGKEVTAECNTIVKNEDKLNNFKDFLGKNGAGSKEIEIAVNAITKGAEGDLEGLINEFDKLPDDVQKEFALYFKTKGDPEAQKEAYDNAPDEDKSSTVTTTFTGDSSGVQTASGEAQGSISGVSSLWKTLFAGDARGAVAASAAAASAISTVKTNPVVTFGGKVADSLYSAAATVQSIAAAALAAAGNVAKGTPQNKNYRPTINFPSRAKGGRVGPNGNGGLTLTGELGTELVWIPSESRSFLVGQYGPEMVNLPAEAVVYPADQTRKILGDTIPPNRMRFGSMVGGTKDLSSGSGSGSGSRSGSGSNSKSKKKSAAEKKIDKYESKKEKLDHLLEMEYISESTYYKKLKALYKKYLKNTKGAAKERRQSLEDQRKAWLDAYEAEKEYYENRYERGLMSDEAYYKKMKALGKKYLTQNGKVRKGYAKEYREWLAEMNDLRSDTFDKLQEDLDKKLEKGLISTEKYLKESKKLQSKYLWTAGLKDEKADAIEEMYENIKDGLDKQWDDILQKIDDNELFGVWTENSPEAIALMQQFYDQLAKDGRKYFATEKEYNEYLLELKRQIAETQKDIYNDQQSDLENLLDLVESMIRQEAEDHIDSLEKQKEAYEEIINAKKKSIELTERELDFQDKLNDYAKDEAKLKSQIETLALDDSREALAKRIELEEELAQLQEERNREVRDETIDRTTDRLDEQAELYGKMIDKQIEIVENWLNNKAAVLEVVADTVAQRETNNLLERLIAYNGEHGDAMLSTVNKAWADINSLAEEYGNDINKIVEALQKGVDVNITGGIISKDQTDYAETQEETKKHHSGIAAGFTGNGADTKQHEVYRLLTDDELVFNREDQMRIASQLQVLDTIKSSYASLAKGVNNQVITPRPSVDLTINAPITIEGNASSEVVGQIEKALENTTNAALNKLENALRINGVRTRASSNMRKG